MAHLAQQPVMRLILGRQQRIPAPCQQLQPALGLVMAIMQQLLQQGPVDQGS
jgi:hypothetical protein